MVKKAITLVIRAQAVALHQVGLNLSRISEQLRCCVRNAIKKFEEHRIYEDLKRSARSKTCSDRNMRDLNHLVKGEDRLSVAKIRTDLNTNLPKTEIVRRYLQNLDYEDAVKITKKPWLSTKLMSTDANNIIIGLFMIGGKSSLVMF